jgi:hypothetical protein
MREPHKPSTWSTPVVEEVFPVIVHVGGAAESTPGAAIRAAAPVAPEGGVRAGSSAPAETEVRVPAAAVMSAPTDITAGVKADVMAPAEIFVRRPFRDNDDPEALMTLWMENFLAENGRPALKREALNEWERRFAGPDKKKPVRGKPNFEHWWWALPEELKCDAGRPSAE